ncbi:hypothetical protein KC351_g53 [Hortaea werneckii]|nr:hypothetical protein KC351_g53 [Hortaea werneckii]
MTPLLIAKAILGCNPKSAIRLTTSGTADSNSSGDLQRHEFRRFMVRTRISQRFHETVSAALRLVCSPPAIARTWASLNSVFVESPLRSSDAKYCRIGEGLRDWYHVTVALQLIDHECYEDTGCGVSDLAKGAGLRLCIVLNAVTISGRRETSSVKLGLCFVRLSAGTSNRLINSSHLVRLASHPSSIKFCLARRTSVPRINEFWPILTPRIGRKVLQSSNTSSKLRHTGTVSAQSV